MVRSHNLSAFFSYYFPPVYSTPAIQASLEFLQVAQEGPLQLLLLSQLPIP